MTRIERVEVEGFKGIESLALEPSGINIITGRNNTGKTSLLEAIQLAFDPEKVEGFGDNVDTLINVDCNQTDIIVKIGDQTRKLGIRRPTHERVREIIIESALSSASEFIEMCREDERVDDEALQKARSNIRKVVIDNISPDIVEDTSDYVLLLDIDGAEYSFLFPISNVQKLLGDVEQELREHLFPQSEAKTGLIEGTRRHVYEGQSYTAHHHLATATLTESSFVGDKPSSSWAFTFVDIPDLTTQPKAKDDEDSAIKIDDIEDFLIEHEILENLRDFDLDYLVFEDEDGDKYSVPYEFMGDGFQAIVGILWELLDDDLAGNVVLLEEPGTHMHPGYVRELVYFLVDLAREEDVQLFITTHDNDFISDFFTENLTDEERDFLQEEFTLVQMQEDAADVMGYEEAEEQLKELHLDLRGL